MLTICRVQSARWNIVACFIDKLFFFFWQTNYNCSRAFMENAQNAFILSNFRHHLWTHEFHFSLRFFIFIFVVRCLQPQANAYFIYIFSLRVLRQTISQVTYNVVSWTKRHCNILTTDQWQHIQIHAITLQ